MALIWGEGIKTEDLGVVRERVAKGEGELAGGDVKRATAGGGCIGPPLLPISLFATAFMSLREELYPSGGCLREWDKK